MNEQRNFHHIAEASDRYCVERGRILVKAKGRTCTPDRLHRLLRWLTPNGGTLLVIAVLLLTSNVWARPLQSPLSAPGPSTSTINYQGRLTDASGNPINGTLDMTFRLYDVSAGGIPLWTEIWTGANSVDVSDGLFNVMLGSITDTLSSNIVGYDTLYLGITVGADSEMTPRVQLGSVPFSMQALTVPDGSITTEKVQDGTLAPADFTTMAAEAIDVPGQSTDSTTLVNVGSTSLSFALPYRSKVFVYLRGSFVNPSGRALLTLRIDDQDYYMDTSRPIYLETFLEPNYHTMGTSAIFTLEAGSHTMRPRFASYASTGTTTVGQVGYGYIVLGQAP